MTIETKTAISLSKKEQEAVVILMEVIDEFQRKNFCNYHTCADCLFRVLCHNSKEESFENALNKMANDII